MGQQGFQVNAISPIIFSDFQRGMIENLAPANTYDLRFSAKSTANVPLVEVQQMADGIDAINTFCQWYHDQQVKVQTPKPLSMETPKMKHHPKIRIQARSHITKTYLVSTPKVRVQRLATNAFGLRDPARLSCDQPWRAYRTSLLQRFPPLILFQVAKCTLRLYAERETHEEKLRRLIERLERWKQVLLESGDTLPHGDTGFEQLRNAEDIALYKVVLHHLLDEQQRETCRTGIIPFPLVRWFVPMLSRILPAVHTWKLPPLTQNDSMLVPWCSPEQSAINSVDPSLVVSVPLSRIVDEPGT